MKKEDEIRISDFDFGTKVYYSVLLPGFLETDK